jgi:hypothetical protein
VVVVAFTTASALTTPDITGDVDASRSDRLVGVKIAVNE